MDNHQEKMLTRRIALEKGVLTVMGLGVATITSAQEGTAKVTSVAQTPPPTHTDPMATITQAQWDSLITQTTTDHQQLTTLTTKAPAIEKVQQDLVPLTGKVTALTDAAKRDYDYRVSQSLQVFQVARERNCTILEKTQALQSELHQRATALLTLTLANPTTYYTNFERDISAMRRGAGSSLEIPPVFGNDPTIRFGINLIGLFLPHRNPDTNTKTMLDNLLFALLTAKSFDDEGHAQMTEINKLMGRFDGIYQGAERAFARHTVLIGSTKVWSRNSMDQDIAKRDLAQKATLWGARFQSPVPLVGQDADGLTVANQCAQEVVTLTNQYNDATKAYIDFLKVCKDVLQERLNRMTNSTGMERGRADIVMNIRTALNNAIESSGQDISSAIDFYGSLPI